MNRKPRIGLIPATLKLFWPLYPALEDRAREDLAIVTAMLRKRMDVVCPALVGNKSEADAAGRALAKADLDLVLVWESGYVTADVPAQALARVKSLPVLLLATQRDARIPAAMDYVRYMQNCALTGLVELGGALSKSGRSFHTISGLNQDKALYDRVADYAVAARVKTELRQMNIGVVGSVFPGMLDILATEKQVRQLGPRITRLKLAEIKSEVTRLARRKVEAFVRTVKKDVDAGGVQQEDLYKACRLYLALETLVRRHRLNAFSLLCQNYVNVAADAPPCLALSLLQKRLGLVSGCEGDIGNAIGAFILRRLTGQSAMFADWTMFDERQNALFFQHCGIADPDIVQCPILKPHSEKFGYRGDGVALEVSGKPGPVTMVSMLYGPNGWRIFASEGRALPFTPRPCGLNQCLVRIERPVKEFLESVCDLGVAHHLNIARGHVAEQVRHLASMLRIEYFSI